MDADMARQQRVHGIFKDFYVIQNRFSCSATTLKKRDI